MKHILIYILIALCIFGFMGIYFAQDDNNIVASAEAARTEIAKQEIPQVGVLINGMDKNDNASFASALSTQLENSANVTVSDCIGDSSVQMNYYKKMLKAGDKYLFVEPANADDADEMISLAATHKATLILLNTTLSEEQIAAYDNVYALKTDSEDNDALKPVASALSTYWNSNRDEMDLNSDDIIKYAVVSDYGFKDSGKADELASLFSQYNCPMQLEDDVVTRYLNYNFESQLDMIFFDNVEVILFADSADAEKAYNYYHDPSEYRNTPKIKLCVMEADETAYSLYESGKVLFAAGNGGTVLGRSAAALLTTLESGDTLTASGIGAVPSGNTRSFRVNSVILRQTLAAPQSDTENDTTDE